MTLFTLLLSAQIFFAPQDFPELPPLSVTAADIVSVAVEYKILQEDNPVFCRQFYGMTDYNSRTITICTIPDIATQRRTLLHEIVHVLYWNAGINSGGPYEHAVERKADELYRELYGIKPIGQKPVATQETKAE